MQIFTSLLLLLTFSFSSPAFADSKAEVWVHRGPQANEVHLNRHHEKSRNATVKIISQFGHGTGTYVKINGSYGILTAQHVVDSGSHYIIQAGLHQSIATLIWQDENADIAILATEKIDMLEPLKMTSSNVEEGDNVLYSGFPSSHQMLTFSCSIANANYNGMLATQCWAWFGSSGSGFLNHRGRVFAVLSAVSVEDFYGHPQVLETLVYGVPIREYMLDQIKEAFNKHELEN